MGPPKLATNCTSLYCGLGAVCAVERERARIERRVAGQQADAAVVETAAAGPVVAERARLRKRRGGAVVDAAVDQETVGRGRGVGVAAGVAAGVVAVFAERIAGGRGGCRHGVGIGGGSLEAALWSRAGAAAARRGRRVAAAVRCRGVAVPRGRRGVPDGRAAAASGGSAACFGNPRVISSSGNSASSTGGGGASGGILISRDTGANPNICTVTVQTPSARSGKR